jgi:P27 family predicted phage terminase small subunit
MPGRPPTPTHLKLLRGNPGKRALTVHEPQPLMLPAVPEPPSFLTGYAAEEWRRAAPEAPLRLADQDRSTLAAYCTAYARWYAAEEALARMADRDERTGALLVQTADGNAKRNPLVKIAAAADMLAFALQFGMTPSARVRLAAGGYVSEYRAVCAV